MDTRTQYVSTASSAFPTVRRVIQKISGSLQVGGAGSADVIVDVSSSPYESGFKFNTIPFGGMTIDTRNAVRIGSATDIKLVPPSGNYVLLRTTGTKIVTPTAEQRGALFLEQGGAGVADVLWVCMKNAADSYAWIQIKP